MGKAPASRLRAPRYGGQAEGGRYETLVGFRILCFIHIFQFLNFLGFFSRRRCRRRRSFRVISGAYWRVLAGK